MKITANEKILRAVTERLSSDQDAPVTVTADESMTPVEEATNHAQAYWLLGWSWDEIEAILEDMGFTPKDISKALTKAQVYARDTLNNGPFSMYKEGQLIRLTNGYIGQLAARLPDALILQDLNTEERTQVTSGQIDVEASTKLRKAYTLRLCAYNLVTAAPPEDIDTALMPGKSPMELTLPGAPKSQMDVRPQDLEKLDVKVTQRAPAGWGDLTKQYSEVEEVGDLTANLLAQVEAAEEEKARVKKDLKDLNAMAKEFRGQEKELTKQQAELAKQVFSIVGQEEQALDDLDVTVFQKYKDKLLGLQRKIQEIPQEPGVMDELSALKEILQTNAPDIAESVFEALEMWKKQNTTIQERIIETFALYPPPKKKSGSTKVAQFTDHLTTLLSSIWDTVKSGAEKLYYTVFPKVDAVTDAIDSFLATSSRVAAKQRLHAAMEQQRKQQ